MDQELLMPQAFILGLQPLNLPLQTSDLFRIDFLRLAARRLIVRRKRCDRARQPRLMSTFTSYSPSRE
jgi:hypothetical protein